MAKTLDDSQTKTDHLKYEIKGIQRYLSHELELLECYLEAIMALDADGDESSQALARGLAQSTLENVLLLTDLLHDATLKSIDGKGKALNTTMYANPLTQIFGLIDTKEDVLATKFEGDLKCPNLDLTEEAQTLLTRICSKHEVHSLVLNEKFDKYIADFKNSKRLEKGPGYFNS